MSRSINRVFLCGHLGHNPELTHSKSGKPYTRLRLATDKEWGGSGGNEGEDGAKQRPEPDWHSVFVWGSLAETCATYLRKGSLVFVEGSLSYWKVASEEGKLVKNAVHGHRVKFMSTPRSRVIEPEVDDLDIPEAARNHNAVAHLNS